MLKYVNAKNNVTFEYFMNEFEGELFNNATGILGLLLQQRKITDFSFEYKRGHVGKILIVK